VAAFLLVCKRYNLDPFLREIFAFEGQGGGVRPIVSVDGWIRLMNDHPQFDGIELVDIFDEDNPEHLVAVEARIFRKDRSRATVVREYMAECARNTDPWKRWPRRMLRHKALIQGSRIAFGFSGIEDEDEYERFQEAHGRVVRAEIPRATLDLSVAREAVAVDPAGGATLTEDVVAMKEAPALRKEPEPAQAGKKAKEQKDLGWNLPPEDAG
jgi:hypothetical protein